MPSSIEIRGLVTNLTGRDADIVTSSGKLVRHLRSRGEIIIDSFIQHVGHLNSETELVQPVVYGLRGLPPPQGRSYYVITRTVAWAAAQIGRPTDDLFLLAKPLYAPGPSRDNDPYALHVVGYQALLPVASILPSLEPCPKEQQQCLF